MRVDDRTNVRALAVASQVHEDFRRRPQGRRGDLAAADRDLNVLLGLNVFKREPGW